jgi:glycine cleavage system H lipoate-binding protein
MMKKVSVLFGMLAFLASNGIAGNAAGTPDQDPDRILEMYYSPELESLGASITEAYGSMQDEVKIRLAGNTPANIGAWLQEGNRVAFVTKDYLEGIEPEKVKLSVVGREIYIPVMNPDNPCRDAILEAGISPGEFARMYSKGEALTWGMLTGTSCTVPVESYRIEDASFMAYLAAFTGMAATEMGGRVQDDCAAVMDAVRTHGAAIGFCTLSQLQQMESDGEVEGVSIIPVDINNNDLMDPFEQLYSDVDHLARGVWIGKYPASLYSRIYAVTGRNVVSTAGEELIRWVVSDGQQYFAAAGYSGLLENEQERILASLDAPAVSPADETHRAGSPWLMIIGVVLVAGLLTVIVFRTLNRKTVTEIRRAPSNKASSGPDIEQAPGGYYMDRSHTWAFMERNGEIRIGINMFLQHVTGKITRMQLKEPGEQVKKGAPVMSLVQHGKTLEILSPVSGTIASVNSRLKKDASAVNSDPYSDGWIYTIEPSAWRNDLGTFTQGKSYREWIRDEVIRLKDFMAGHLKSLTPAGAEPVYQEGGELRYGLLEQFGPEAWEEFQSGYLHS